MIRRNRWSWFVSLAVLATGLVLLAAACGGGGKKAATTTTSTVGSSQQKTFPNFRIVYDTGTDYLDPGLSYTVEGWEAMWNVYLSLLGYKHVNGPDGATIVPALAQALPQVSADGLTYTMTLRPGPEVLERDAGEGERLQVCDQARLPRRLARCRLLHEHRGRRFVLEDEEGRHRRDHDRRRDGEDHDQAREAAGRLRRTSSRRSSPRPCRRARRRRISRRRRSRRRARTRSRATRRTGSSPSSATRTSSRRPTCRRRTRTR